MRVRSRGFSPALKIPEGGRPRPQTAGRHAPPRGTACNRGAQVRSSTGAIGTIAPLVELEPVSVVGAGDALLAQWVAARLAGASASDALRAAVATGSAAVLEVGAGRFDPTEAKRLAAAVEVHELHPVS